MYSGNRVAPINPRLQTKQETFAVNVPKLKNKLEEAIKGRVGVFKYCNVHCVLKRTAFEKELKQEKQQMTHF